jgi:hypothetical protein|nr:MAG TPA: hypothetical protein [Caudoviricetes sp.]
MKNLWKDMGNNRHTLAGYTIFVGCGAWHIEAPYGYRYSRSFMSLANAKRFVEKKLGY